MRIISRYDALNDEITKEAVCVHSGEKEITEVLIKDVMDCQRGVANIKFAATDAFGAAKQPDLADIATTKKKKSKF